MSRPLTPKVEDEAGKGLCKPELPDVKVDSKVAGVADVSHGVVKVEKADEVKVDIKDKRSRRKKIKKSVKEEE